MEVFEAILTVRTNSDKRNEYKNRDLKKKII